MPTLAELTDKNNQLIMRWLENTWWVAPYSADPITEMMDSLGVLAALPTGYRCVGWTNEDGAELSRDMDTDNTTSDGTLQTTRIDRTQDDKSFQIVMQETNAVSLGLYHDIDTTALATLATGEFSVKSPDVADTLEWRAFNIGRDNKRGYFMGTFFPLCTLTDTDSRTISTRSNDMRNVTLGAQMDDALGTDMQTFYAPTSTVLATAKAAMEAMGIATTLMV